MASEITELHASFPSKNGPAPRPADQVGSANHAPGPPTLQPPIHDVLFISVSAGKITLGSVVSRTGVPIHNVEIATEPKAGSIDPRRPIPFPPSLLAPDAARP